MQSSYAVQSLHTTVATLLANHPHKETVGHALHKTAASASAIIHGPHQQLGMTLAIIAIVILVPYALFSKTKKKSSS